MAWRYLLVTEGAGFAEWRPGFLERLVSRLVPRANPGYDIKLHLVAAWAIEFQGGRPEREIGLDARGSPIVRAPSEDDYGFWLDSGMMLEDFTGAREMEPGEFEMLWADR